MAHGEEGMIRSPEQKRTTKNKVGHPRLCWTRHELVGATGLSYRTLINLEKRGLLHRCLVGINVACYTNASVQSLFGGDEDSKEAGMVMYPGRGRWSCEQAASA